MANRVLGSFLLIGILILILSLFMPGSSENKNQTDPATVVVQPTWIEGLLSGFLAVVHEIKESFASDPNANANANSNGASIPPPNNSGEDPNEIFKRAYQANEKGDYLKAVTEYSRYLELVPGDASGYYNRGLAQYTLKQYNVAVKDFEKAVEIDPNKTGAFLYKGYANEMLRDCPTAVEDFQKAIDLGEKYNAELYGHKARCENTDENYDDALKDAQKAVNLDKKDAYAYFELAYAQYGLGRYQDSAVTYTKVLQLTPKDEVAFHNRGLAYVFLKKNAAACKDFQKSLDLGYADAKNRLKEYCSK
ncbi:tetratricopeptide repeat protein [Leptospira kmetyi]|uniref:Tetratricopeptide repeat protein n=1 Tax=Leptospira kmetyi TaxID=408139 RepID=A0ABX4N5M5_9LEPT|nr:tetratricopeptide repeat protein [Leptospira kmetyi]EQA52093.1 tetratricopeptide repeat protein [Leptospira kmetyi serovar Malaysia str. Bejo-Iso9]PJZ28231.1 hypothetical protein CH378_18860 [Leptospira kmetyi]PJZ40143.1 hypothetical protein CH370_18485 [Leptospira kmetyi]TGK19554.1 tetratricopeptide repeat protein [Leptospira kmetyi]TGK26495.1 tetratricopeptide repeat protein [Leptospira kmetyi]